jgi:hypothetical protein
MNWVVATLFKRDGSARGVLRLRLGRAFRPSEAPWFASAQDDRFFESNPFAYAQDDGIA